MVTTEEMRAMARRYDTTMAHAFRRALHVGGYVAVRSVARLFARRNRDARAYSGIRLCFRNYGSPMDGLR